MADELGSSDQQQVQRLNQRVAKMQAKMQAKIAQLQQPRQRKVTVPQAEYEEFRQFQLAQQAQREQEAQERGRDREREELMARFQQQPEQRHVADELGSEEQQQMQSVQQDLKKFNI